MTCQEFDRQWTSSPDGTLTDEAREHLSSCRACSALANAAGESQDDGGRGFPWSRRGFVKASASFVLASLAAGKRLFASQASNISLPPDAPVEYIVVGSGAGGGPLACRLALAGHKVVLFEAGGRDYAGTEAIPLLAAAATEDPSIQWNYWVRHYADTAQQQKDTKYVATADPDGTGGIWYPRVGALGGCTIHSALIAMYPSDSDWDAIAAVTGDSSWNAKAMRTYFERVENCQYAPQQPGNPSRHGYSGWLPTSIAAPSIFGQDTMVKRFVKAAIDEMYKGAGVAASIYQKFFGAQLDPNDMRVQQNRDGYYNIPSWEFRGFRASVRDFILQTQQQLPNNLIIQENSLVTRVLFDGTTATGVEYLDAPRLYRADPNPAASAPSPKTMSATREVILAAGAFNSPQLLKLSGIGPRNELTSHNIPVLVDLPGVGENLQDRYEIGIITQQDTPFTYLLGAGCTLFQGNDPCAAQLFGAGAGPYTTTGLYAGILGTSSTAKALHAQDPDIFIAGAAARFKGYYPGYSVTDVASHVDQHTWLILKAHTLNRAGRVTLRSADPRDTPIINFHYFGEGGEPKLDDLAAVVDAIEFVRNATARVAGISNGNLWPGPEVQTREQIAEFVRNEAWGHHASCTNRMGPSSDPMAVVDSDFRVHGTNGLRVVDASIFPRIPGYFILAPIYMISEKASDVILADA